MHDLHTSTALRQLADLGVELDPSAWAWAIVGLERSGRLSLPPDARSALGAAPGSAATVIGTVRHDTLVIRIDGAGRRLTVDRRGRIYAPTSLRRTDVATLLTGTRHADRIVIVLASSLLDRLGDVLAGVR